MSFSGLVLLLVGAVLGAIIASWYNALTRNVTRWINAQVVRRRGESVAKSLPGKIVKYYVDNGLASSLYVPRAVGSGDPIAMLHSSEFHFTSPVDIKSDPLFSCDHAFTSFPVSNRALRWYRRRGVKLFDGEFMWLKSVRMEGSELQELSAGRFNFYGYATLYFRLQHEISSRWRSPKLHGRYLSTFDSAISSGLQPQAIGCTAATLLQGDDGLYIALAKRSEQVLLGPGTRALLPVFGMECNAMGGRTSEYGLTFYNFVREFSEEFFDLEELVDMMSARRVDPDWMFQLSPAAAVLREATAGRFRIVRTGFGVNPNDGILNCALVAHFSSPKFFKWLRTESRLNWESAPGAASLEFVKLDDPRLDEWVDRREIEPSSVFALDLARQYAASLATRAIDSSAAPHELRRADRPVS
jgi:hypothetical protein